MSRAVPTLADLAKEYRPSMDREILHSWAEDVVAALSAAQAQPVAVDGWQLVPKRLTAEMMEAACRGLDNTASMNAAYELALEAAPAALLQPPVQVPVVKALRDLIVHITNSDDEQMTSTVRALVSAGRAALSTQAVDVKGSTS